MSLVAAREEFRDFVAAADLKINDYAIPVFTYLPSSLPRAPFILIEPESPYVNSGQTFRGARIHYRVVFAVDASFVGLSQRQLDETVWAFMGYLYEEGYPLIDVSAPGPLEDGRSKWPVPTAAQVVITQHKTDL